MFSWTLLTALGRRWYLLLLTVLVTAGATYLVVDRVDPTYELRANIVLLPPDSLLEDGENPFLALGGLTQVLDVLVRAFPPELRHDIQDTTGAEFEVGPDAGASGPIMVVTVEATTPTGADEALREVLDETPRILEGIQDTTDVPVEHQVTSMVIYQEVVPDRSLTSTLRAGVLVGGASMLAGVLAIAALDGPLLRRATKRAERGEQDGNDAQRKASAHTPSHREHEYRRPSPASTDPPPAGASERSNVHVTTD